MTGNLDLNMKREQQRNLLCCSGFGPAVVARLQDGVFHKLIHRTVPVQRLVIADKISCCVSITTTRAEQHDVAAALGSTPRFSPRNCDVYIKIDGGLVAVVLPVASLPCRYQVTTQRAFQAGSTQTGRTFFSLPNDAEVLPGLFRRPPASHGCRVSC